MLRLWQVDLNTPDPAQADDLKMKPSAPAGLMEKWIIPILREVAEALKWVHQAGIIHRDIKCKSASWQTLRSVELRLTFVQVQMFLSQSKVASSCAISASLESLRTNWTRDQQSLEHLTGWLLNSSTIPQAMVRRLTFGLLER